MAYDINNYDLDTCLGCPSALRGKPPCQQIGKYTDGSLVPIARDDLGVSCPFAASWATVKSLAQKYPNIPRMNADGYYAIGKIHDKMNLRKSFQGVPTGNFAQDDPVFLGVTPERGSVRMYWQDFSNGRNYYFLQSGNLNDWLRFDEWFRRCCIGPVPVSTEDKILLVCKRCWDYLGPAASSQVMGMLNWETILLMAGSLAVIIAAALSPAAWLAFLRNVTLAFGFGLALLQFDGALARLAQTIYSASTRRDLERTAQALADVLTQIAAAIAQAAFFKALQKGPAIWKQQLEAAKGETFHTPEMKIQPVVESDGQSVRGVTKRFGDMLISIFAHVDKEGNFDEPEFEKTKWHERLHSALSPKFFLFRDARASLRMWGYSNVMLLRLLEEAMAETYAQCKVDGINLGSVLRGLKFPFQGGYLSISSTDVAITGTVIGYIVVHGTRYCVTKSNN